MRTAAVSTLLVALFVLAGTVPASAVFPNSGPKLLYSAGNSSQLDLRAINTKTGATSPVQAGATNIQVAPGGISPDGKRIAYFSNVGVDDEIWVAKADGSNAHQITTNSVYDLFPRWSPDGKKIAYVTDGDIAVMNPDGTGSVVIHPATTVEQPTWSPSGNRIAFSELGAGPQWDILSMKPNGSDLKVLAGTGTSEIFGDYSPDGRTISYYRSYGSGAFAIFTMNADGTHKRPLIVNGGHDLTYPEYSADGSRILYQYYDGTYTDIWSARASDGKQRKELLATGTGNSYLAWTD